MNKTVNFYQIWYKEEAPQRLDFPALRNLPNGDFRYLFFESRVLELAVKSGLHLESDFFGLLSPNYLQKIEGCKYWGADVANTSSAPTTKEGVLQFIEQHKDKDVIGLTSHPPHHVCKFAEVYHPNFCRIMQMVLDKIGYDVDINERNTRIVYFNYFAAKKDILERFTNELLSPFIAACYEDEILSELVFRKNSNYAKDFPENLKQMYGIDFYPYAPFLAERLITLFLHKHKDISFITL